MGADTQVLGIVARETPELCISVCVLPSARALVSDLTQTPGGLNATSRTRSTGDTKGPIQSTCRVNRRCSTHESQSEAYTLDLTTSPEQALSPHKDARASDRAPQGCRLPMCNIMQLCGPSVVRISHPLPDVWRALDWASCRIHKILWTRHRSENACRTAKSTRSPLLVAACLQRVSDPRRVCMKHVR